MKKCIATFDGFIGWRGQATQIIGGSEWNVDHPMVVDNPQLFRFPEGGEPETPQPVVVDVTHETPVVEETLKDVNDKDADGNVEEELPPYVEWVVKELQDECRVRGLSTTGNKSDLVTRLEEWDKDNPDA